MAPTPRIRAHFDLRLAGDSSQVEKAVEQLAELLSEHYALSFDEDFLTLHGEGWELSGLRLMTRGAVRAALELLPTVDCYMVEVNPERLDN